jgi:hypothetical protein
LKRLGSDSIEPPEQPKIRAEKDVERPRGKAAEFGQDHEERGDTSGISKREDQLDARFLEIFETGPIEQRRQGCSKQHQQGELGLNLQKIAKP